MEIERERSEILRKSCKKMQETTNERISSRVV
jgi:hypothetical protein